MAVKFFGQFLVEFGVLSRETLLEAIALQESVNKSIGDIVFELGYLSENDREKINIAQRSEDLRFGDLAVKMGLLSEEQIQQALAKQKESHLYIGEALVKVGGLNDQDLKRYLEDFKADQSPYATDHVELPEGVINPELWEMVADMTYKMFTRVARLIFRPVPCRAVNRIEQAHIAAAMDFTGDIRWRYVISVSEEVQSQIAKVMLGQEIVSHESRELLDDTVMEFINVICGNIVAKAVQLGKNLDIMPPEILDSTGGIEIPAGYTALHFEICLTEGSAATTIIIYP